MMPDAFSVQWTRECIRHHGSPGAVPVPLVRGEKQRKGKNDAARSSCLRARVHLFFLSDDALRSDAPLSSSEFSAPRERME